MVCNLITTHLIMIDSWEYTDILIYPIYAYMVGPSSPFSRGEVSSTVPGHKEGRAPWRMHETVQGREYLLLTRKRLGRADFIWDQHGGLHEVHGLVGGDLVDALHGGVLELLRRFSGYNTDLIQFATCPVLAHLPASNE